MSGATPEDRRRHLDALIHLTPFGTDSYRLAAVHEEVERWIAAEVIKAKVEGLREAADELAARMSTFSAGGRHTRATWAVAVLRDFADGTDRITRSDASGGDPS